MSLFRQAGAGGRPSGDATRERSGCVAGGALRFLAVLGRWWTEADVCSRRFARDLSCCARARARSAPRGVVASWGTWGWWVRRSARHCGRRAVAPEALRGRVDGVRWI
jgi:hypothetical protein